MTRRNELFDDISDADEADLSEGNIVDNGRKWTRRDERRQIRADVTRRRQCIKSRSSGEK